MNSLASRPRSFDGAKTRVLAPMTFGSVCSGIEAASVAWHPLGWRCAFAAEIEAFPRAVLQHRWPETPLHGDFTTIEAGEYDPIDLLVGGTPCQSFSVAGLRGGLADGRGNLALEYLRLADRLRPRWLVWENVPGVLSSNGGRDFGSILGGLGELGYGFAYRVLDAQFFGVAQRRRRVFVVGHLGDWRRATAVLFERHCLQGHPAPRRVTREGTAYGAGFGPRADGQRAGRAPDGRSPAQAFGGGQDCNPTDVSTAIIAHPGGRYSLETETFVATVAGTLGHNRKAAGSATNQDAESGLLIAHTLKGEGFDASEDGTGRGTPIVPVSFTGGASECLTLENIAHPVTGRHGDPGMISFALRGRAGGAMPELSGDTVSTLRGASGGSSRDYIAASAVRRLTPRECERLQGFRDDYTAIPYRGKPASDGPRYKALGNSMAVPVMRWLGERIAQVETLTSPPDRSGVDGLRVLSGDHDVEALRKED